MLFARHKGDIGYYMASARRIDELGPASHVLIAEACTHAPASEDIGRVKLPRLLRQRAGGELSVTVVAGKDFPDDLSPYDLVIHCGACMFKPPPRAEPHSPGPAAGGPHDKLRYCHCLHEGYLG